PSMTDLTNHRMPVADHKKCAMNSYFFIHTSTTDIYTLSLHDALPTSRSSASRRSRATRSSIRACPTTRPGWTSTRSARPTCPARSEEHTSELQSLRQLVCRLLLEKKNLNIVRMCASHIFSIPLFVLGG